MSTLAFHPSAAEATWDWLRASRPRRDVAAITPEEKQKGPVGGGVEATAAQARDAYAFGQFTLALLNYIEEENEGLEMLKGIEEFKVDDHLNPMIRFI